MSTFTDGAPPSVSPEPGDDPGSDHGREPGPANGDPGEWLQEEIRRRMAARAATGGGARHARRGAPAPFPGTVQTSGHQPRHSTPPGVAPSPGTPGPGEPVPPARILPSRARRFDAQQTPSPAQPAAPPAAPAPGPRPTPSPAPRGGDDRAAFGGPAALHPALGGQAPEHAYGAPVRPRPRFGDPALLGGDVAPTTRPVPVPAPVQSPPDTPPPGTPVADAPDAGPRATGMTLPPSVAFRAGAAAARATGGAPAPVRQPPGADETGPAPVVDPAPDAGPLPPNGYPTGPNQPVGNLRGVDPPAAPAKPVGAGLPAIGSNPVRVSRRPVPPAGTAAARLLSPPPSPPSTPTGIPIDGGPTTPGAGTPPAPATPDVDVPVQRAVGATDTTDLAAADPGTAPRRYLDYEDYDDDYEDPELDAEIAEAAQREAAAVAEPDAEAIKRVRVVLAERKSIARPVRTVEDVRDGTTVGEVLRRGLIRSQLKVALSFAAVAMLGLGVLPVVFAYLPVLGRTSVLGIRLPWLVLGGLVYPFLLGLGWWHARTAEKVEKGFADHVQD